MRTPKVLLSGLALAVLAGCGTAVADGTGPAWVAAAPAASATTPASAPATRASRPPEPV